MSPHLLLDLVLVLVVLAYARRGWTTGLLTGLLSMAGLVLGFLLGLWLTPKLLAEVPQFPAAWRTLGLLGGALLFGLLGQSLLGRLGWRFRPGRRGSPSRRADATLGAIAAAVSASLVLWLGGAAVRPLLPESWGRTLNESRVLTGVDAAVPQPAKSWPGRLTQAIDSGFPRVFSGLTPEPRIPVPAPDPSVANSPAIRQASASIVRVRSSAPSCGGGFEGSGWVVAPHRVVTNAHVVAGSDRVSVQVANRVTRYDARVVAFDPDLDLAILDVGSLPSPALARAGALRSGADTVVAGFPLGGPYTLAASRVRGTVTANGEDIHGKSGVARQVYSLRTTVEHGNSGGPLLTTDGRVAGTIFARSMVDSSTGYALTDAATDNLLDRAASLRTAVSTQGCAVN